MADHLDSAPIVTHYQIFGVGPDLDDCLFGGCSHSTGASDRSDGIWIWTDGLGHAVGRHHVQLPEEFIDYVLGSTNERHEAKRFVANDEDESYWLAWSAGRRSRDFLDALDGARSRADQIAAI